MKHQSIAFICAGLLTLVACGGASPAGPGPGPSPGAGTVGTMVYLSANPAGPWAGPTPVSITGHGVRKVVDVSPMLMPDGSILVYYAMANDEALTDVPSIGVAQSTDGINFAHRAVALTPTNVSDPFPLRIDSSGTIRLFFSQKNPTVRSATSIGASGLGFSLDAGTRSTTGGVPGALKIGSTYFLYVNANDGRIAYLTSNDGLTFTPGGTTGLVGEAPSPIDVGGGTYLMSYICVGNGAGSRVENHESCLASSTNGTSWAQTSRIGRGSVPGLVRDGSGMLRVYVAAVVS